MFLKNRDYFQGYVIKRLLDLVNYLTEVIKQTDKSSEHKYALVDYFDKKGSGYCRVHTIGTGVISDFKPSDIMIDDDFISGFNHLDVRTISNLAHMEKNKAISKIFSVDYVRACHQLSHITADAK